MATIWTARHVAGQWHLDGAGPVEPTFRDLLCDAFGRVAQQAADDATWGVYTDHMRRADLALMLRQHLSTNENMPMRALRGEDEWPN